MEKLILGLDISTVCIGFTIATYNQEFQKINIEHINYIKFKTSKKYKDCDALFYKAMQFKENFIDKYGKLPITDVIIEEPLISSNNAFSCHQLTKFNGMISQLIFSNFNIMPKYISSFDARKYAFPDLMAIRKYDKEGELRPYDKILKDAKKSRVSLFGEYPLDCQKKEILHQKVTKIFTGIKWILNSKNELKNENYDANDSLVCILGYINSILYPNTQPQVIDYEEVSIIVDDNTCKAIDYVVDFCGIRSNKRVIF